MGRPVLFFVLAHQAMGKPNDSKIRAVENIFDIRFGLWPVQRFRVVVFPSQFQRLSKNYLAR